jgi:hypothetical protein
MTPYPPFPEDELRASAPANSEAHQTIDALRTELTAERPNPQTIRKHVEHLSQWDNLVATLERWYLDSRTQAFIAELTAAGL